VFIFFDGNRDKRINIRPDISKININVLNYYFDKMRFMSLFSDSNNYFSDEREM